MKLTGAQWKAYLNSWPADQWYDDDDATVNGVSAGELSNDEIADAARVVLTCGVVFKPGSDEGVSLTSHLRNWLRSQDHQTMVVQVPKNQIEAFAKLCKSLGIKEIK